MSALGGAMGQYTFETVWLIVSYAALALINVHSHIVYAVSENTQSD